MEFCILCSGVNLVLLGRSMNYVAQIKEFPDKQNESDLEPTWSHVYIPLLWLKIISTMTDISVKECYWFTSTSFIRHSSIIYICQHHLSARLLSFTLSLHFYWLLVTATVILHPVVNRICFHKFRTHKTEGRFEQFPNGICWGLGNRILRLVLRAYLSILRGSHWYLKAGSQPPLSTFFKIHHFNDISFACVPFDL